MRPAAALPAAAGGTGTTILPDPAALLDPWRREGAGLWASSTLAVTVAHAGILAFALLWSPTPMDAPPPSAAMMIELAPLPASAAPPTDKAAGVRQEASRPEERRVEEPPKVETPVKKAEVAIEKPKPRPKPTPPIEAPKAEKLVEQTTAPVAAPSEEAAKTQAPSPGASVAVNSNAAPTWQGALRAHLERFKRYPSAAQFRRQEGVVLVRFSMNRDGGVLWARLERGSGHDRLDEEGLALLERAQPLPAPPPEVTGDPIEIVAPVRFFLR